MLRVGSNPVPGLQRDGDPGDKTPVDRPPLDYKAGEDHAPSLTPTSFNGEGVWRATAAQTQAMQYAEKLATNPPGFNRLLSGNQFAPQQSYNKADAFPTGGVTT